MVLKPFSNKAIVISLIAAIVLFSATFGALAEPVGQIAVIEPGLAKVLQKMEGMEGRVRLIAQTSSAESKASYVQSGCRIIRELVDETVIECPEHVKEQFEDNSWLGFEVVEDEILGIVGIIETDVGYSISDIYTDIYLGATTAWSQGYTGKGRLVAVLDTGIDYTHESFGGCESLESCEKIIAGWDFVNNDPDPMDDSFGHGTHVAGIIAANILPDVYATGVAHEAMLMIGKVCDSSGLCWVSDVLAGIEWAVNGVTRELTKDCYETCGNSRICCRRYEGCEIETLTGRPRYNCTGTYVESETIVPDAISMSFGGDRWINSNCKKEPLAKKIKWANRKGVTVVIAAGNKQYGVIEPACDPNAIAVGALGEYGYNPSQPEYYNRVASFSSRGYAMEHHGVLAPGVHVYSTFPGNRYGYMSGTSVSPPHVAGLIALMKQKNPRLSSNSIERTIFKTAEDVEYGFLAEDRSYEQGHGMIDMASALRIK